jgi:integrase
MSIYKRGETYWYKFMWRGKLVRESTKQGNNKVARQMESAHRTALAKGEVGIREKKAAPRLSELLNGDFLPFVQAHFPTKPKTQQYYEYGIEGLLKSGLAQLRLDEITSQHAAAYAASKAKLSPSTVNCGLRTLRRALNLAEEWGKLSRAPKISLAKGERQRDRVLTEEEAEQYLAACPQPWQDVATIMLGTGACPWSELAKLRWEHVLLNGHGGIIQIAEGKTKSRKRLLPMVPAVYQVLKTRHETQGCPREGWVFPTSSESGHLEQSSAKNQHTQALRDSKVKPFPPYVLRHTALTWLAPHGDVFALMRAAGHSQVSTTMRYVHPQSEAIEQMFEKLGRHKIGHNEKLLPSSTTIDSTVTTTEKNR